MEELAVMAQQADTGSSSGPLGVLEWVGTHFIGLFTESGKQFVSLVTGILPTLLGVANGVAQLGISTVPLALRYFLVGILVIFIRGVVTERITAFMIKRTGRSEVFADFDRQFEAAKAGAK
jgi:sorbitol-specific phosphotransferase system component IIC